MARDRSSWAGKKVDPFYVSAAWRHTRLAVLQRDYNICQVCKRRFGNIVHHIIPRSERPELEPDMDNLQTVCDICHNQAHPEKGRKEQLQSGALPGVRVITL